MNDEKKKGLIGMHFTPEEKQEVDNAISVLEKLLANKLVALTPEKRKLYGSISETNKLVVDKVENRIKTAPNFKTEEIDWTEFYSDYSSRKTFDSWISRLGTLSYQIESTKILHDHDNYHDALDFYSYIGYQKRIGTPGAAEIYDELKQFFARHRANKNTPKT